MMTFNASFLFAILLIYWLQNDVAHVDGFSGQNVYPAIYEEYPYAVCISGLRFQNLEDNTWCTGTMISYLHVLTSDHCLSTVEEEPFRLICGSNNLYRSSSYFPAWYLSHDQWCENEEIETEYQRNDVAIIKLLGNIIPRVTPAEISPISQNRNMFGLQVVGVGWGKLTNDELPVDLQVAHFVVNESSSCEETIFELIGLRRDLGARYLCSSSEPYTHLNDGDSGGPILYNGFLIGISKSTCPNLQHFEPRIKNIHIFINFYRYFIDIALEM